MYLKEKNPTAYFCLGGGYLDAGTKHSGGVFQVEYKWGKYFWGHLRPQMTLTVPEFSSFFLGLGMGWDCKLTERITLTPSFSPGFYYKGKSRNLGYPLEFRSAIELSYRFDKCRIGIQALHISNAHLAKRNPGLNAYILYVAVPISNFQARQ